MAHLVRGIRRDSGDYEGNQYDNIYLHCCVPGDNKTLCGEKVEVVKMKAPLFSATCDRLKVGYNDLVGCSIRVFYSRFESKKSYEVNAEDFDIIDFPDTSD